MIRKEAWSFYRTISGVRLCWELEEPEGPKGKQFCAILTTEGRVVRPCWEKSKPIGPKSFGAFHLYSLRLVASKLF